MQNHGCLVPASSAGFSSRSPKNNIRAFLGFFFVVLFGFFSTSAFAQTQTAVQKYGQLRVSGNRIVDKNGQAVALRGMSLYWSQWVPKYYNYNTIKWLRDDWKITVIRIPMAVDAGGYETNPTVERNKVIAVVDAAISLGIYAIIDFHVHDARGRRALAQSFFSDMAQRYGNTPNVLYETWNEPLNFSWATEIKPYHEAVIASIRQHDPDNIIICGTRNWSQEVDEATANPINLPNIAYTLHFYADSHKGGLRAKADTALNTNKKALFVTEYGTVAADGKGNVNAPETNLWWDFLDANMVGHANWSLADIPESSAVLIAGASVDGGWSTSQIKPSGQLVRNELRARAPDLSVAAPVAAGTYSLRNRSSGKMLDNLGSTGDGALVGQWTDGTNNNQRWVLSYVGGYAKLQCVTGGKFLDSMNETATNRPVGQWANSSSQNQQWTIQSLGGGYYRIVNRANGLALDSGGFTGNTSAATPSYIEFWDVSTTTNQQWQFVAP